MKEKDMARPSERALGLRPEPQSVSAASGFDPSREEAAAKVIFLDIDGPMIPATMLLVDRMSSWHRRFPATTVAVLRVLCENTGAKIVFNTTHNLQLDGVENIDLALIGQGLPDEHLHQTDRHTLYPSVPRDVAIKEWLARHPEVTHWVALDDVRCAEKPNMIHVDPNGGLHVGHLNRAAKVLEGTPCLILM